jgi:SpoVK/Ycf46/Vps4 family AAA+-type ATPase
VPSDKTDGLFIVGIPYSAPEVVAAVCRSRLLAAVNELLPHVDAPDILVQVGTAEAFRVGRNGAAGSNGGRGVPDGEGDGDAPRPERYSASPPRYVFEHLVVPDGVLTELTTAIEVLRVEGKVFDEWGLRRIEPSPKTALNFHGPPGTGKTLAAHAIAHRLGRHIIVASYAEIESKFHGDGPKNVKAIFQAAERDSAVLFIDEADSLLSRRLTNVTQGSEQAINSMRSQLLICLEQFHGVVIFSTNLVENYDQAFETRVRHVHFPMPDLDCRREIWRRHLVPELPLEADVNVETLADKLDDVCGRDIKNAVIDAAVRAAVAGRTGIALAELLDAADRIKAARVTSRSRPLVGEEATQVREQVRAALSMKAKSERTAASAAPDSDDLPASLSSDE